MELALTLGGDTSKQILFLEKSSSSSCLHEKTLSSSKDIGFCMGLGKCSEDGSRISRKRRNENHENKWSQDPLLQLDLLPSSQVTRNSLSQLHFPWLTENSLTNGPSGKVLEMKPLHLVAEEAEEGAALSSPNSAISTCQVNFPIYKNGKFTGKKDHLELGDIERWGANSRISDEEADGLARKKLRLTKEQSAFLEESFKEHSTLNPKQKLALAKQLNLRPRQVEVWFQNRRARTKLKQTEVDCEYLKKCCETLTEENKRLQKELQELRALKSSQPFYMQLPATTLTMCPSCERVATTTTTAATGTTAATSTATTASVAAATSTVLSLAKVPQVLLPFSPAQVQAPQAAS